ncbi:MAG: tripartite tricarboxylate transporter substrate binding protein [Castellaniella sp.]
MKFLKSSLSQIAAGMGFALSIACVSSVQASDYPNRTIEFIVMWPAGGGGDTATRIFAKYLEAELGQTIVVKNVVGGGGSVGYIMARQARPDGYTLVMINGDLAKYKPAKLASISLEEFDILGGFSAQAPILIVQSKSPWKNLSEFVDAAKENPDKITVGVSDIGGQHHVPILLWEKEVGINLRAVSHSGSSATNTAILGGHVDSVSSYIKPALPYIENETLRPLAYFGTNRAKTLPDIPTFQESGYEVSWIAPYGIGGPKGLSAEVKERLAVATKAAISNSQYLKDIEQLGLEPYPVTGAELKEDLLDIQAGYTKGLQLLGH